MSAPVHWRRPLKDGGVEFYFASGDGNFMRGDGSPRTVDDLQEAFEFHTRSKLPAPEWKPARGKWAA